MSIPNFGIFISFCNIYASDLMIGQCFFYTLPKCNFGDLFYIGSFWLLSGQNYSIFKLLYNTGKIKIQNILNLKALKYFEFKSITYLLLNCGPLKLGALKDNIIPQGKWRTYSVSSSSFAKLVLPTDFGTRKDRCVTHLKKEKNIELGALLDGLFHINFWNTMIKISSSSSCFWNFTFSLCRNRRNNTL